MVLNVSVSFGEELPSMAWGELLCAGADGIGMAPCSRLRAVLGLLQDSPALFRLIPPSARPRPGKATCVGVPAGIVSAVTVREQSRFNLPGLDSN